jgi:hypothetical protein
VGVRDGREVNVRVQGQLVFNMTRQMPTAALAGYGLAYVPAADSLSRPSPCWSMLCAAYRA